MEQKNQKKNKIVFKNKIYLNYLKSLKKTLNKKYYKNIGLLYKKYSFTHNKIKLLQVDNVYKNCLILKFINNLIKRGNKTLAEKLVYKSLQILKLEFFNINIKNFKIKQKIIYIKSIKSFNIYNLLISIVKLIKIPFEIKNIRIGGRVYQVPFILKPIKQQNKAVKMIINTAKKKLAEHFIKSFVSEILKLKVYRSVLNRYVFDYYKLIYDNRSFAHYRWY